MIFITRKNATIFNHTYNDNRSVVKKFFETNKIIMLQTMFKMFTGMNGANHHTIPTTAPPKPPVLPQDFHFKNLPLHYLDEICHFLMDHYIEDPDHIVRLVHSKSFIYWWLQQVPVQHRIGLIYQKKLMGLVTAVPITTQLNGSPETIHYINLLCVQKPLRNTELRKMMIDELHHRIYVHDKEDQIILCCPEPIPKLTKTPFCVTYEFMVPINLPKLKRIGFLEGNDDIPIQITHNPLRLMKETDIASILPSLNHFSEKFKWTISMTPKNIKSLLIPKKNIVYSFVKRNVAGQVTDFISVYKHFLYCLDQKEMISTAQLAFYYHQSMTLTQLVVFLIDKLRQYQIDQLSFRNSSENLDIEISKYTTQSQFYYYGLSGGYPIMEPNDINFFPF